MKKQQRSSLVIVMLLQLALVALAAQAWLGLLTPVLLQPQQQVQQQQRMWSRGARGVHDTGSYGSSSWQSRGRMVHGCVMLAPL
jgi:hypothetical protein